MDARQATSGSSRKGSVHLPTLVLKLLCMCRMCWHAVSWLLGDGWVCLRWLVCRAAAVAAGSAGGSPKGRGVGSGRAVTVAQPAPTLAHLSVCLQCVSSPSSRATHSGGSRGEEERRSEREVG